MLTHISQRYHTRALLEEAQAFFPSTIVARDFDHFRVTREAIELLHEELSADTPSDEIAPLEYEGDIV